MTFKTINKLFKGELIQVTPCKGYGYVKPAWNKEALSSKNLYCYYASESEKQRKKCFLKIFEKGGEYFSHEVIYNYKGEETWIPSNPQTIYFEVEVKGSNHRCTHLYDERHLSFEEKTLAEANSIKEPDFDALLKEQEVSEAAVEKNTEESSDSVPETGETSTENSVPEVSEAPTVDASEKTTVSAEPEDEPEDTYSYLYNCRDEKPRRQKKYDAERSASKRDSKKASQKRKAMKKAFKEESNEEKDSGDLDR